MTVERILIAFLEKQKDQSREFREAVESLAEDKDGCLETDGASAFKGGPETDSAGSPSVVDEEICRRIGAQLAELGDMFEREALIKQEVVDSLAKAFVSESLTEERFGEAVASLLSNVPAGVEQEKATLAVVMLLTSKIGKNVPGRLQSCFYTAVTFIQSNCSTYVEHLTQQG